MKESTFHYRTGSIEGSKSAWSCSGCLLYTSSIHRSIYFTAVFFLFRNELFLLHMQYSIAKIIRRETGVWVLSVKRSHWLCVVFRFPSNHFVFRRTAWLVYHMVLCHGWPLHTELPALPFLPLLWSALTVSCYYFACNLQWRQLYMTFSHPLPATRILMFVNFKYCTRRCTLHTVI